MDWAVTQMAGCSYAMRLIRGDSLQEAIRGFHEKDKGLRDPQERSLAFRELLGRFVDVCQAIAFAHSRGVLHRDLKPGNVMLGKYGETLVVDWGLAKTLAPKVEVRTGSADIGTTGLVPTEGIAEATRSIGESPAPLRPANAEVAQETAAYPELSPDQPFTPRSSTDEIMATQMGQVIGTPAYMSPEQAAGRLDQLGPASDVYSLGATLYHMMTGRPPFEGPDQRVLLTHVQVGEFPRPRSVKNSAPAALEAVCLRAMALEPAIRYQSAQELATEVERWLADEPWPLFRKAWRRAVGAGFADTKGWQAARPPSSRWRSRWPSPAGK